MSEIQFAFDREKAIEVIIYLAQSIEEPTFHSITHLLYFADKTSLERYGRFTCGDDYYAMQYGPVPTNTYNLLKLSRRTDILGFVSEHPPLVKPLRNPNLEYLSDSDIECLNKAIEVYATEPFWKIKQDSHDGAYNAAWNNRGDKNSVRMSIENIVELLKDSEELLNFLTGANS
jgi:uncharacterized phage-associated protein